MKDTIAAVGDNRKGVCDAFEASTLGTTASPAEYAATQKNLRQYYLTPGVPLRLKAAHQEGLDALYGQVSFVGVPQYNKAFTLGITGRA